MSNISRFRPCIDLHDGQVKQIVGGSLNTAAGEKELKTNFVSEKSPAYYAELYKRDQLSGGHVIKLGPGNEEAALAALRAYPGGLQLGGGVNADNAQNYLDAGAAGVIVTSFVFADGIFNETNMKKLLKAVGRERIILDLSCRKTADGRYLVVTDRWKNFTQLELNRATLENLAANCCEFLVHAVDVEGKCSGIDRELLQILAENSPLKCVYAGGIASPDDIRIIADTGKGMVDYTIGSALDIFGGNMSYQEIVKSNNQNGVNL
ncbi:MAG: phosphoribosylformimino-5-aminoimidazole carboxamide ribotide isomerase [Lentisphaeria bacterium]|nr:phosphoribosylformimino-5-aminoimidazole carboxamide ribotide isomerase [Lentisphaeria bacterium]